MEMKITIAFFFVTLSQITLCQGVKSEIQLIGDVKLISIAKVFTASEHKLDTCDTGLGWLNICRIDGKPWFGGDAGLDLPKYQLSSLILEFKNKSIKLDVSQMFEPAYNGILQRDQLKITKTRDGFVLDAYFSDGAGTYVAQWKIKNGISNRTVLTKDESQFWMN
jgi:hypothetical protein